MGPVPKLPLFALFSCLVAFLMGCGKAPNGALVYETRCAVCHDQPDANRAPARDTLARLTTGAIYHSITDGGMAIHAAGLPPREMHAVVEFLTGRRMGSDQPIRAPTDGGMCAGDTGVFDPASGPQWNGWGVDTANTRFQCAEQARLPAASVPELKLKWAFGFPDAQLAFGHPTVVGGRVFVGSERHYVYSLDAATGCTYWSYRVTSGVRAAINIGPFGDPAAGRYAAYFGDLQGTVYAVDASTGRLLWKTQVEKHRAARVTGSPVLHDRRLYVPMSSNEELLAGDLQYECCTFRGSLSALDAQTGKILWKTYTMPPAARTQVSEVGTQLWGPSGGAIWSAPTVDPLLRRIYAGTGNPYTAPDSDTTDAVVAFDMATGALVWSNQMTREDWFSFACVVPGRPNCPDGPGPDFDFASSPILRTLPNGRRILAAGQKSGMVFGLDPDRDGELVWETRVGRGSGLGGVQWGPAADFRTMYVAVSDMDNPPPEGAGGLIALNLANGRRLWRAMPQPPRCFSEDEKCSGAQSAAVTAIPGVVFSGSVDGYLRAYSATSGKTIWQFYTAMEYDTVNGVKAHGGSINAPGPTVVDGMVFVNSGYSLSGMPGNVLLAFSVDGR
jgi:polyvinyl alcohol dehydrogenase (cytochrome)